MWKKLSDFITRETYYRDIKTGILYRRAVCALAWPSNVLAGCVVVLGEQRDRPFEFGTPRHIDLIADVRSESSNDLILAADRLQRAYFTPRIITPEDDDRIALIQLENDQRRIHKMPLMRTTSPIMWHGKGEGLLPYYIELVHARIKDSKTLTFGRDNSVTDEIKEVATDKENDNRAMLQWPGLCALCWALEAIDRTSRREWEQQTKINSGPADLIGGY